VSAERLFDQIVIVRWSVASQPTRGDDSTWRASVEVGTEFVECVNNATRIQASRGLVDQLVRRQGRIFVGFDIPFGFPTGFASRIVNPGANWRAMWMAIADQVVDGAHNDDNRFEAAARLNVRSGMSPGPLWGTPDGESRPSLGATRPDTYYGMTEFRLTERRLREVGHEPRPVWQLRGRRAPGSLALLGIPFLRALSEHRELTRRVRIWPFETGCTTTPTHGAPDAIVLGEVWPDVFDVDTSSHQLPDAAAAIGLAEYLARLDRAGSLGALFAPSLTPQQIQVVEREEGWVLGA
jgi:hypothetical protein